MFLDKGSAILILDNYEYVETNYEELRHDFRQRQCFNDIRQLRICGN